MKEDMPMIEFWIKYYDRADKVTSTVQVEGVDREDAFRRFIEIAEDEFVFQSFEEKPR